MLTRHTTRQKARTTRRAFTLLEILVVVAIIVMLAGIGGYYYIQQLESARAGRAKADCEGLSAQVEIYKMNNHEYPTSIDQLAAPQPNGGSALVPPDKTRDPWGKPYTIDPSGQHNSGLKADVYTVTPKGQVVGNWGN